MEDCNSGYICELRSVVIANFWLHCEFRQCDNEELYVYFCYISYSTILLILKLHIRKYNIKFAT